MIAIHMYIKIKKTFCYSKKTKTKKHSSINYNLKSYENTMFHLFPKDVSFFLAFRLN